MKEATGELNMTVVTVIIIAALAGIGATVILPAISGGIRNNSCQSMLNDDGARAVKSGSTWFCCPNGVTAANTASGCMELAE